MIITKITITPEEKFNQEIWWILQEIKKEQFATPKEERVEFIIRIQPNKSKGTDGDIPHPNTQKKLLYKLKEWRVLDLEPLGLYLEGFDPPKAYNLTIYQTNFDEIYDEYQNKNTNLRDSQPIELYKNDVIKTETWKEILEKTAPDRRMEQEHHHQEKLQREQLKQQRILGTKIDKYAHALDLIIERAEFTGDGNNFIIEFYDFNFEQMLGSRMLEKFLTEMQKDDCFEKYTRTNYAGGTRFGFINPNIKKLKEFKEKQKAKSLSLETKKKQIKETDIYLNQNGDLYREPKNKYCYPMSEKSNRYKIVRFLAMNRGYRFTKFISKELDIKSEKTTHTEIGKIRNNIKKYLKIDGKDFLQGKKGSGYRINPKYKIVFKNE